MCGEKRSQTGPSPHNSPHTKSGGTGFPSAAPQPLVRDRLACRDNDPDKPLATLANVTRVLELDPKWRGRLRFDELAQRAVVILGDDPPRPVQDVHVTRLVVWLSDAYGFSPTASNVDAAIREVADRDRFHPIADYLSALEWDGTQRVAGLFHRYFGASAHPLVGRMGECFMLSMVARALQPGCKADTMPILQGRQGLGKSTGLRALAGDDWFKDSDVRVDSKDVYLQFRGVWLLEVQEIDKWLRHKHGATVKSLLSSQEDTYRPPYGRHEVRQPRGCIAVGTTNEAEVIADHTGSRRFWPVAVGKVDVQAIRRDRDQLWAEAVAMYGAGHPWHLTPEEDEQLAAYSQTFAAEDPWHDGIASWLARERPDRFKLEAAMRWGARVHGDMNSTRDRRRVSRILQALGCRQATDGNSRFWVREQP